jgi:hypothetical protein
MQSVPRVAHLVISLAHGGLEKLVVDWTNGRNRRQPGSTEVFCLDAEGDLAPRVEGHAVFCLHAHRGRFPFDLAAVKRLRECVAGGASAGAKIQIVHSHNLAAQQYAALGLVGLDAGHVHTQHGAAIHNLSFKIVCAAAGWPDSPIGSGRCRNRLPKRWSETKGWRGVGYGSS